MTHALNVANWVRETSSSTGTGDLTMTGAQAGAVSLVQAFGTGITGDIPYSIQDDGGEVESGVGSFNGTTLVFTRGPTSTFVGGVYDADNPSPVDLQGPVVLGCTLNAVQFKTLLESIPILENGFTDRTESTIAFDEGTRTFTISPVSGPYHVCSAGIPHEISVPLQLVIPDVTGTHFIYMDENGDLQSSVGFFEQLITTYAFVSVVAWNSLNQQAVLFGDERHGNQMDAVTHYYNHMTTGSRFSSGFALTNFNTEGSGDQDIDAQCAAQGGRFFDEDIEFVYADGQPQDISPLLMAPFGYRDGPQGDWVLSSATGFIFTTAGSGRAAWNEDLGGGAWGASEVNNTDFVNMHLLLTNDVRHPFVWLMGQAEYPNAGSARDGAEVEINSLSTGSIDSLFPEFIFLGTVIGQTNNGYTNAVKTRVRETNENTPYVDWRGANLSSGSSLGVQGDVHNEPVEAATTIPISSDWAYRLVNVDSIFYGNFNVGDPGSETGDIQMNGDSFPAVAKINRFGPQVAGELILHRHSDVDDSHLVFSRSLGNDASHVNVINGTSVGDMVFSGWADTSYWMGAVIRAQVDGTPAIGDMPTRLDFMTSPVASATPQVRMSVRASGTVEVGGSPIITQQDFEDLPVGFGTSWKFSTDTTIEDPTAGLFRFDTADMDTATTMAMSKTVDNGLTLDLENEIKQNQRFICYQHGSGADRAGYFIINGPPIDHTTWMEVPVAATDTVGTIFGNNKLIQFSFFGIGGVGLVAWGELVGNLPDQVDLQTALNLKLDRPGGLFLSQNYPSIQAAIDAAFAAGSGVVLVANGEHNPTSEITLRTHVWVFGVSRGALIRRINVTEDNILHGVGVTNVQIRNLTVDGNRTIQTKAVNDSKHNNIRFSDSSDLVVENVESRNAVYHGVFITTQNTPGNVADRLWVQNNYLHHNGYRSAHIHGTDSAPVSEVIVTGNESTLNGQDPDALISYDTGLFVCFLGQFNTVCANNTIYNEPGFGLTIQGRNSSDTATAEQAAVQGNTVRNCQFGAIITGFFEDLAFQGNVIRHSVSHGLQLSGDVKGVLIQGNNISRNGDRGIIMQAATAYYEDISITANTLRFNAGKGIEARDVKGFVCSNNLIADSGVDGVGNNGLLLRGVQSEDAVISDNLITSRNISNPGNASIEIREITTIVLADNICKARASGSQIILQATVTDAHMDGNVGQVLDLGTNTKFINYV